LRLVLESLPNRLANCASTIHRGHWRSSTLLGVGRDRFKGRLLGRDERGSGDCPGKEIKRHGKNLPRTGGCWTPPTCFPNLWYCYCLHCRHRRPILLSWSSLLSFESSTMVLVLVPAVVALGCGNKTLHLQDT
jgi:hypothetical protein